MVEMVEIVASKMFEWMLTMKFVMNQCMAVIC